MQTYYRRSKQERVCDAPQQEKSPLRHSAGNGDLRSVATPLCLLFCYYPERKGGKGTDVTKFEIVWWKAQSIRRIESSNVTNSLKLTDQTEGVFEPKKNLSITPPFHSIRLRPSPAAFYLIF